jgi:glycine oxidase
VTARPDVVIVGGGPIGLATAWRAAQAGLRVTLVDAAPGTGASYAAAGMLAPVTEAHYGEERLLALNLASADAWPTFATEVEAAAGAPIGYAGGGTVVVAFDADDHAVLDELHRFHQRLGLPAERLRSREVHAVEPMVHPSARSGMLAAAEQRVDPRALTAALVHAAERAGVTLLADAVVEIITRGDRAVGVRTGAGVECSAGSVVLAAGCHSGSIAGLPPTARPPVRPVKGQVLTLAGPPVVTHSVRGLVRGSSIYMVPRDDGRLVVGATVEEMGFDTTVTATAAYELLRDAITVVPAVGELELTEVRAGLRPGSPDNAPMIGAGALDGLVVATGHFRNGVLLTPVTADAVVTLLTTGSVPDIVRAFDPCRFGRAEVRA